MFHLGFSSDPYQNHQILLKQAISKEILDKVASEITQSFEIIREKNWMRFWQEPTASQPFKSLLMTKVEDKEVPLECLLAQFPTLAKFLSWDNSTKELGVYHYSFREHHTDEFYDIESEEEAIEVYKQKLQNEKTWEIVMEACNTVVEFLEKLIKSKPHSLIAYLLLFETIETSRRKQSLKMPYVEDIIPFGNQELYTQLMQNLFIQTGLSEKHLLLVDCMEFEGNHNDNEIWAVMGTKSK